jgi:transcriptional regulator with XRE-family HTH domain
MANEIVADSVAENIRTWRKTRGWTVAELADRCIRMGAENLTASAITNIELRRRGREVTVSELATIANALNISPSSLMDELMSEFDYGNPDDAAYVMDAVVRNLENTKRLIAEKRIWIPREFR